MSSAHRYVWTRADGTVGKAWRAHWTGVDGKRSKRGFERKGDAEAYGRDREAEVRHGVTLADPVGSVTVGQWAGQWTTGLRVRPSTADAYGWAVKRICADLGRRPVTSLRASELRLWRKSLDGRYAPSTAAQTASMLAMILRAAVEDGMIAASPMPPERGRARSRTVDPDELLSTGQVRAWGAAMPDVAREMPLLAAMTGLRQGELLGLRLPAVDFLRRELWVVEQLVSPFGAGQPAWGPPKTAAGVRTVPLPPEATEALARHLAAFPAVEGEPIFRSPRGHRWRRSTFGDVWRAARDTAGLPSWAHWHGLRDVYASTLLRQGVDAQSLIAVMGHTSLAETQVYARLWADSRDNVRASVAAAWTPAGEAIADRRNAP